MTANDDYTERLVQLSNRTWKRRLNVQAPYRWNLRRLHPGRVLDVGCGIGRNLAHLDGNGVGVDHNATSVQRARDAGLVAYTPADFLASPDAVPHAFDTLLLAHVLEHLNEAEGATLLRTYLPYVRPGGSVIVITPQERGFASDSTHVRWVDAAVAGECLRALGITVDRSYSFPLPRIGGRLFRHNEFVAVGRVPSRADG